MPALRRWLTIPAMRRVIGVCGVLGALFLAGLIAGRTATTSRGQSLESLPTVSVATVSRVRVPTVAAPVAVTALRPLRLGIFPVRPLESRLRPTHLTFS